MRRTKTEDGGEEGRRGRAGEEEGRRVKTREEDEMRTLYEIIVTERGKKGRGGERKGTREKAIEKRYHMREDKERIGVEGGK